MSGETYSCSLHDEAGVVVEATTCWIYGHPGITDWSGRLGPTDAELEIGPTYRLRLADGRDGLIVIARRMRAWGDTPGHRYEFEGKGALR